MVNLEVLADKRLGIKHLYLIWNANPNPWELDYIPISRDKARELDKARKDGKLPERLHIIDFAYSEGDFDFNKYDYGLIWKEYADKLKSLQKDVFDSFDTILSCYEECRNCSSKLKNL